VGANARRGFLALVDFGRLRFDLMERQNGLECQTRH
jgi:hypothetical protein